MACFHSSHGVGLSSPDLSGFCRLLKLNFLSYLSLRFTHKQTKRPLLRNDISTAQATYFKLGFEAEYGQCFFKDRHNADRNEARKVTAGDQPRPSFPNPKTLNFMGVPDVNP
jgi:hypothetical protein